MGLAFCSDCTREGLPVDLSSCLREEDDDITTCSQYPPPKVKYITEFPSVKRPKLENINIDIVAGHRTINSPGRVLKPGLFLCDSPASRGSRCPSLKQQLAERKLINSDHQTPLGYYDEGEREAECYIDALEDNTLTNIQDTNRLAQSMAVKTAEIAEELRREGDVIMKVNRDVFNTEQEINDASRTLKGMTLHGKVTNMLRSKSKRLKPPGYDDGGDRNLLCRSRSLPAKFAYRSSPGDTKQQQIKDEMKQLIRTMDTIRDQNLGIAEEMKFQEPHLRDMSNNMSRVQDRIVRETTQINQMH